MSSTSTGFRSLIVYQKAYQLALDIFSYTKSFPKEETYALTDQIRRSSRSVCSNIAEGYRKRQYPKHFASKISDADSEASETIVWLDFAKDFGYLSQEKYERLMISYEEVGRMLYAMNQHPEKFLPKKP